MDEDLRVVNNEIQKTGSSKQERIDLIKTRLRKVTPELLGQFLIERCANRSCLSCGASGLSVPEVMHIDQHAIPATYVQYLLDHGDPDPELEAIVTRSVSFTPIDEKKQFLPNDFQFRVNCNNCGFTRLYRASPVLDWIESKGSDSQEAE